MSNSAVTTRYALVQVFSAVLGAVYLLVGVWGWVITGLHGEGDLLIFDVNPLHNVVHIAIGLTGIAAAGSARTAAGALLVLGGALGLVTVLGFVGLLGMLNMYDGIANPDNFLHLVTGVAALTVGLLFGPDDGPDGGPVVDV